MTEKELAYLNGPWSNGACKGYVIAALEALNATPEQIAAVVGSLNEQFELMDVQEAQKLYMDRPFV